MTGPATPLPPRRRRFPVGAVLTIAELAAFVAAFYYLGVGVTILITLATFALGSGLLRYFGAKAIREYTAHQHAGTPPGPAIVDGAIAFIGAVGLMIPGLITDAIGLLCVFPPTRALLRPLAVHFLETRLPSATMGGLFGPRRVRAQDGVPEDRTDGEVIEGEIIDGDDPRRR